MNGVFDRIFDFIMEKIFFPFFVIVLCLLVLVIPFLIYACYQDSQSPTFSLKKDEWSCTKIHEYTTTHHVMVGKVMVPQTTTHKDCIQWSKK